MRGGHPQHDCICVVLQVPAFGHSSDDNEVAKKLGGIPTKSDRLEKVRELREQHAATRGVT